MTTIAVLTYCRDLHYLIYRKYQTHHQTHIDFFKPYWLWEINKCSKNASSRSHIQILLLLSSSFYFCTLFLPILLFLIPCTSRNRNWWSIYSIVITFWLNCSALPGAAFCMLVWTFSLAMPVSLQSLIEGTSDARISLLKFFLRVGGTHKNMLEIV